MSNEKLIIDFVKSLNFESSYQCPSAWIGHEKLAHFLIKTCKPKTIVELGVHNGFSYFSFCQTVHDYKLETKCFGIDHWQGDLHASLYDEKVYEEVLDQNNKYKYFSELIKKDFNSALVDFKDHSIDFLHIDGYHTYDAVKSDFTNWLPKCKKDALILFHDVNKFKDDFGVYKFFNELKESYSHFISPHAHGLGVITLSNSKNSIIHFLNTFDIQTNFSALYQSLSTKDEKIHNLSSSLSQRTEETEQQAKTIETLDREIKKVMSSNSYKYTAPLRELRRISTNPINNLKKIINVIVAYLIISKKSFMMRLKFFGKSSKIHFEKSYQGQKILLLALYEKERLRPDIENLLIVAKQLGMYVLAINTSKVLEPNSLKEKIDCYIERPNFGQDFGSYKTGFLHLFKQGWEKQCPRLIMLNDSVFYSRQNLATFLNQMINTDIEALGATENYQIKHHLQSFCISISKIILEQAKFKKYWKYYQCSNFRPNVIKSGEIKLSKIIRSCVSSPQQMSALYSAQWLSDYFKNNSSVIIYEVLKFCGFGIDSSFSKKINIKFSLSNQNDLFLMKNIDDISNLDYLQKQHVEEVKQYFAKIFLTSSAIHYLGVLLFYLGAPLIKLDGLYRGTLQIKHFQKISSRLDLEESHNFKQLIFRRPYGGDNFNGWKLAAFRRGYI
jgi:hypothetical protein